MKTTVELPEALLREAKAYAARHGISLREVVERSLDSFLNQRAQPPFKLKTLSFDARGMAVEGGWPAIRALIYEGHGG